MKRSKSQIKRVAQGKKAKAKILKHLKESIKEAKLFGLKSEPKETKATMPTNVRYQMDESDNVPSNNKPVKSTPRVKKELTPEMQARELAARKETEKKSKRIAPLFNKGAYQYISDETDPKTIGRK